jgi:1-acyl-sn-glycerol-3-phosphate acyltransferase
VPSDSAAVLTLLLYAAVATTLVLQDMLACCDGWRVWVLHIVARFYTPFMFRQRVSGLCPLPGRGPALVISNHRSPVDPILVWSGSVQKQDGGGVRTIEYLTAREYCELGGPLGWITRVMQVIPVARSGEDMGAVKLAVRRLKQGRLVGVFPEGRINTGTELLPANPGVAWLALHARVPVYPVFIYNAPQGEHMVQPFHTFSRVRVVYGPPVDLSAFYGRRLTQEILQEVTDLLMARLAGTGCDADLESKPDTRREVPRLAPATRAG